MLRARSQECLRHPQGAVEVANLRRASQDIHCLPLSCLAPLPLPLSVPSLLTTTTYQCQHILGHSSGQPQGSCRRHICFRIAPVSLSASIKPSLSSCRKHFYGSDIKAKKYGMSFVPSSSPLLRCVINPFLLLFFFSFQLACTVRQ